MNTDSPTPPAGAGQTPETTQFNQSVCYYCRGPLHAIKDCPACQDIEETRRLLLDATTQLRAAQAATQEARKERDALKAQLKDALEKNVQHALDAWNIHQENDKLLASLEAVRKENEDLRGRLEKIQRGDS